MLLFLWLDHRATHFHRYSGGGGLLVFRIGGFAHLVSHADGIGERILYGRSFRTSFLIGFGAGAISPVVLGAVLDLTNPGVTGKGVFFNWGWAFSVLGIGGLGAWLAAIYYGRMRKNLLYVHSRNM